MTVELAKQAVPVYIKWTGRDFGHHIEVDEISVTLSILKITAEGNPKRDMQMDREYIEVELWDTLIHEEQIKVEDAADKDARELNER